MMQVTVCGGGNAAHVLAGLLGRQNGLSVHVYTPYTDEAERWQGGIERNGGNRYNLYHENEYWKVD